MEGQREVLKSTVQEADDAETIAHDALISIAQRAEEITEKLKIVVLRTSSWHDDFKLNSIVAKYKNKLRLLSFFHKFLDFWLVPWLCDFLCCCYFD